MRATILPLMLAATLLAGCSVKINDKSDGDDGNVTVADSDGNVTMHADNGQFALNVPGFSAKLAIPGLHFSPQDMDIDGLKLFPGAKTTGMNVDAHDKPDDSDDDGVVRINFASASSSPQAILDYYRGEAARTGYTVDATPAAGSGFSATKKKDDDVTHLAVAVHPDGAGSSGTVTITGS